MELQFSQYQHQCTPVPSTGNVSTVQKHVVADMNTLEAFHIRCQRLDKCFRDLVCQPLVTSYIIVAYLCLAMLHTWILQEHQHMMSWQRLIVDTYEGRKPMASWRRPPDLPRNVWLNNAQNDADTIRLSTLCRSEVALSHGAEQRSTTWTTRR